MKWFELTYDYSMAKHQRVIECSATSRHPKQLRASNYNGKTQISKERAFADVVDDDIIVD